MSRRTHHPPRRHVRPARSNESRPVGEIRPPSVGRLAASADAPEAPDTQSPAPPSVQESPEIELPAPPHPPRQHALARTSAQPEHVRPFRMPAVPSGRDETQAAAPARASNEDGDLEPAAPSGPRSHAADDHASPELASAGLPTSADDPERAGCTAPQLRRFIKSRAYVPMHELRRRFAIIGTDDDVTPVDLDPSGRVFVGLPTREGRLLGELLRAGDVGYELSLDPISPIVVGVFPMRPVPRA